MDFHPPDAATIARALGDISKLPVEMQLATTKKIDENFQPIPKPRKIDWLACYEEKGQTIGSFALMKEKAIPRETFKTIYVQPLGSFNHPRAISLDIISEFARVFFSGCEVSLLPAVEFTNDIISRKHYGKKQYLTRSIFDYLSRTRHRRNAKQELLCVAVTMADIYPDDDWNFVYGEANIDDGLGVYSFARLDPLFQSSPTKLLTTPLTDKHRTIFLRRCVNVFLHEVGHLFGLLHCIYYVCLMNGANHGDEMDRQPLYLCPVCLHKLYSALNFNVQDVYEKLANLCETYGLEAERIWYRKRLDCIRQE